MMISTRTIAALAATGLLAAGVGGAAALDSANASQSSVSTAKVHTWKFAAIQTASHGFGKFTFGGTDKDRKKGKLVGYDTISGKFNTSTHVVEIDFALSRKGGLMFGNVTGSEAGTYTGAVTGGTGRYKGATGTVTGHDTQNNKKTLLTVKWTN